MKNKKGISPLIATVLLIGFSVALAAVVMTWGLDYLKGTTEKVGGKTDEVLLCATELDFEISSVDCNTGTVQVQNNGAVDIANLTFRVYKSGDVLPQSVEGIPSLGIKTYTLDLAGATKIEALAHLRAPSGIILCKDASEEYVTSC